MLFRSGDELDLRMLVQVALDVRRVDTVEHVHDLDVAEVGKQSGVVLATLKGATADGVYRLLSGIGQEYMAQNSARRTEEADKSLAWLNQRLPELKQQLEQAEARYNQFRNLHGTVDIGEEGKINLQRSAAVRTRKVELEQKRLELLSRYTGNHPAVIAIDEQLRDVNRELREAAGQLRELPVLEQEMVKLARDVKVNNELYGALLSSAQQLQLITVGKTSNVRLVDAPERPDQPVGEDQDDFSKALTSVRGIVSYDVAVRHAESFAAIKFGDRCEIAV